METRLVKKLPNFTDNECKCGKQAKGIFRQSPKQKWAYLCEDCLGVKLGLEPAFIREVFDV
jgi:hypothetical protein